ncbi:MAG: HTH-type transcriptional regulator betI [Pseudonocardiales bacterium]|nr:HTH-type transcriptional regulator betI [Pseudonocardiales bacterium]
MGPDRRPDRRRDPVARRQAIVTAAIAVIAERGPADATHRAIAARADVPLGATTYYFPTLADLHAAALTQVADETAAELLEWSQRLAAGTDLAVTLASLCSEFVARRDYAIIDYEFYVAAARNPQLRSAARHWVDGTREVLTRLTDAETAFALVALIDGAMLEAVVTDEVVDEPRLAQAIRRLLPH